MVGLDEQVEGPAQKFGGEEGGEGAAEHFGREVEHLRAETADDVAHDIDENDADGGEFDLYVAPQADEDGEEHRQQREDERVGNSGKETKDGDHGVQHRESMDQICRPYPFHCRLKYEKTV